VAERQAEPCGQVPLAAADVRASIHDPRRDRSAVRGVAERDPRPARQGPMGNPDQGLGHRVAAGGPLAVEAGPIPRHVAVVMPLRDRDGTDGRVGLDPRSVRAARGNGPLIRIEQDRRIAERTAGPVRRVKCWRRRRCPIDRRSVHRSKERGVDRISRAGALRPHGSGDGDRSERGDERHARDDSGASHVRGTLSVGAHSRA